jgi:hypothetical protein
MDHKRLLPQMIGLTLVTLLLVSACGAPQPTPTPTPIPVHGAVQRVKAFHEAINAVEPGKETGEGKIEIGKGFNTLVDIFREHTTRSAGLPMSPLILAMASGIFEFSNMEYGLVSESAECAVVRATGDITTGEETEALDEEYVVVKQGGKWLIDPDAKSCY